MLEKFKGTDKEKLKEKTKDEAGAITEEFKGIKEQLRTTESIVLKNDVIAILHNGPKNQESFLKEFENLTKEGYRLATVTETRGLPVPMGFDIKTGKLFFFQHEKWFK